MRVLRRANLLTRAPRDRADVVVGLLAFLRSAQSREDHPAGDEPYSAPRLERIFDYRRAHLPPDPLQATA